MEHFMPVALNEIPFYARIALSFLVFMMGASLGSFIQAFVYRTTKSGKSIVFERSECTSCGRKLNAIDLVPLFSFLFLRGKCRTCKKPIAWRYFGVELACAVIVSLIVFNSGLTLGALGKIVASLVLLTILLIDFDTWLIPIALPIFLVGWGVLFGVLAPDGFGLLERVIGASAGFGVLAAVLLGSTWFFRRTGRLKKDESAMGWGDPILMAGIGALVGYKLLVVVLWIGSIQAIIAYVWLRFRRHDFVAIAQEAHAEQDFTPPENALPLGTFLCLAGIEVLIATSHFGL
jgi:leader peptidase (prepilin peptidase)/N-methyltransferase